MKMRMFLQNKMWRDKGIELMENMGSRITWRYLNDIEYDQQLRIKLLEEAEEVQSAISRDEIIAELADVLEVIDALSTLHNIKPDEISFIQTKKSNERGGFFAKKFIEAAEHPEGSFGEQYCLANPEKYPEITE
jgi:predicted house-cleaning noncanonical NTP pyrophosphatase (MazG superfamily)